MYIAVPEIRHLFHSPYWSALNGIMTLLVCCCLVVIEFKHSTEFLSVEKYHEKNVVLPLFLIMWPPVNLLYVSCEVRWRQALSG